MNKSRSMKKIGLFLGLTLVLSGIFYYLILQESSMQASGGLFTLGLMWCPGISAIITQLIFEKNLRGLGWRMKTAWKQNLIAIILPVIYAGVAYGIIWISGLGGFPNSETVDLIRTSLNLGSVSPLTAILVYFIFNITLGLVISVLSAAGEEIGWRGLFVPELYKATGNFTKTALISGAVWALWHMPLLIFSDYNTAGAPRWFALICFFLMVMAISIPFAWQRLKSGSMWPAILLHAAHNVFVQQFFTPLTIPNKLTPYLIDEFGIGLVITIGLVGFYFWRKRGELPAAE